MLTKRSEPLSPISGERCEKLMWSLNAIRLPGGMAACRLPAALVCTSTSQPQSRRVRIGSFMPSGSPVS